MNDMELYHDHKFLSKCGHSLLHEKIERNENYKFMINYKFLRLSIFTNNNYFLIMFRVKYISPQASQILLKCLIISKMIVIS